MPKVHIVCSRPSADRILPRKSRYLVEELGWSLSPTPNPKADINYFLCYLDKSQKYPKFSETVIGAYFTHYDIERPAKARLWEEAVEQSDFCITTARRNLQYLPKEKTYFARPPVEVDKFTITSPPKEEFPVVGVSGYTYGDGRKGEGLIRRLVNHPLSKYLRLTASGRGWPGIKTLSFSWGDLPKFFQNLDILIVPSLNEGVPMTPLEALSCGVKIVIPRDVGIMDELPEMDGIYRFDRGDFESMIAALREAVYSPPVKRESLREIILNDYTVEHWAKDHLKAIDAFYYSVPKEGQVVPWEGNSGAYLVAFGEQARECAKVAIKSVNTYMPDLPVALVSTDPLGLEDVFIQHEDIDVGGRIAKLKMDILSPKEWEYILYLDADTELVEEISPLFKWLESGWELIICKDMSKYATADMIARADNKEESNNTWEVIGTREHAFQYNGGMMVFRRNKRTENFFSLWRKEWDRWAARDQGALLRALYQNPLKLLTLFNNWNASDRYPEPPGDVAIWHFNMAARRWGGKIWARTDSEKAWDQVEHWETKHGGLSPKDLGH